MIEAGLSDEHKRNITAIARQCIVDCVSGARTSLNEDVPLAPEPDVTGVFVTIRVHGCLRGCIGFVDMRAPFGVSLLTAAERAATEDTRFESIKAHELESMTVDVTLLYPLEDITGPTDITLGTHGVRIDLRGRRGLLLPQVAIEQEWTAEEFLEGVCSKAMLPSEAWRDPDVRLSRFRGVVLGEQANSDEKVSGEQQNRST